MRTQRGTFRRDETFEQWRMRLLEETSRFIEWGLAHPDQVARIPTQPVGLGGFSARVKKVFWAWALRE